MVVINSLEELPSVAQLHALKQMQDIRIARGGIISTRVAYWATVAHRSPIGGLRRRRDTAQIRTSRAMDLRLHLPW